MNLTKAAIDRSFTQFVAVVIAAAAAAPDAFAQVSGSGPGSAAPPILRFNRISRALDLALSPDGRFAVVRGEQEVAFIDLQSGQKISSFATALMGNVGKNGASDLVEVSHDSTRVVALGMNSTDSVLVFDTSGATPVLLQRHALPNLPHDVALAPNGDFAAVSTDLSGSIDRAWFFDLATGKLTVQFPAATGLLGRYTADSVVVSPDSSRVIVTGGAGTSSLMFFDTSGFPTLITSVGTATPPHDVEIARNLQFVAVRDAASPDGSLFLDLNGNGLASFGSYPPPAMGCSDYVAISPDSQRAVTIGFGGYAGGDTVNLFDTSGAPGSIVQTLVDGFLTPAQDVAISSDSRFAVVAGGSWAGNNTAFYDLPNSSRTAVFPCGGGTNYQWGYDWGWGFGWWGFRWGWGATALTARDYVEIAPDSRSAVVLQVGDWKSPNLVCVYDCTQSTPKLATTYGVNGKDPHDVAITPDSTIAVVHAGGDLFFALPSGTFLGSNPSSVDYDACDNVEISSAPRRIVTLNLSGVVIYSY